MKYGDEEIGGKHIDYANMRFSGDEAKAREYIPIARNILGALKHDMGFNGLDQNRKQVKLQDGTIISVSSARGTSDVDQIHIDTPTPTPSKEFENDRCIGFICKGFYDGPFSDEDVEINEYGFNVSFRCLHPGGEKTALVSGSSGSVFDGYPDNGCKIGPVVATYYQGVTVATQSTVSDVVFTSSGPRTYDYSGAGNITPEPNAGWSITREAIYGSVSCGEITTTTGTYCFSGDLLLNGSEYIRSDIGYGVIYSGDGCTYNPNDPWIGNDHTNIRQGDLIAEALDLMTDRSASAYADWTAEMLALISDSAVYKDLNFGHQISKSKDDKGVVSSLGAYLSNGVIYFADVRESFNGGTVGGGTLVVLPTKGVDQRFALSPYTINKNFSQRMMKQPGASIPSKHPGAFPGSPQKSSLPQKTSSLGKLRQWSFHLGLSDRTKQLQANSLH